MAIIKAYTDLKQSRKLAEILPLESADMFYTTNRDWEGDIIGLLDVPLYIGSDGFVDTEMGEIYAWSLTALLGALPKEIEIDGQHYAPCLFPVKSKWLLKLWYNSNYIITSPIAIFSDNPVDAYYEMILKLNELNLL